MTVETPASSASPAAPYVPRIGVVQWPPDFVAAYPKGGIAQFILDPRWGREAFRELLKNSRYLKREDVIKDEPAPSSSTTAAPASAPPSSTSAAAAVDTRPPNPTDLGNARRLVALFGDRIRFVATAGKWFIFDGARWARDDTNALQQLVERTIASIFQEAAAATDSDARRALFKQAMAAESARAIKAMIHLAERNAQVSVGPAVFDTDPWLYNVENGTIDLRTGRLRAHAQADLITKLAPIRYDPAATCPRWLAFLDTIFAGRADLVEFVRRAVGYSLTGSIREQVIFFLYGTGANGKSTFLDVFRALLGNYGQTADFSSFTEKDKEVIRNDLADLAGARLVTAAETRAGQRLDEAVIKKLTGGDPIKARFLFREHFVYLPTFKIFLATNHRPVVRGGEHAIWRRIRLIPFEVTIPDAQQDQELAHKLREELPGILTWAVGGCVEWQRKGLGTSEHVTAATEEYREEMDTVAVFKKECLVEVQGACISSKALYERYCDWTNKNGDTPQDSKWFGRSLNDKGFKSYKSQGVKLYRNLELRSVGDSRDSCENSAQMNPRAGEPPNTLFPDTRDSRDLVFEATDSRARASAHTGAQDGGDAEKQSVCPRVSLSSATPGSPAGDLNLNQSLDREPGDDSAIAAEGPL